MVKLGMIVGICLEYCDAFCKDTTLILIIMFFEMKNVRKCAVFSLDMILTQIGH